jgi:hypothetical protein
MFGDHKVTVPFLKIINESEANENKFNKIHDAHRQ